jgi:hypothetical protein
MDFRETRYKTLRSETMVNIWYTDTEGWLMPKGASKWGSIDAASPIYWGWTGAVAGTAACRIGSQPLGAMLDDSISGTGAALTFAGPITFPQTPTQQGSVSLWTLIGGVRHGWYDSDGLPETFTNVVMAAGTGGAGPYAFTSKVIALAPSSVSINWVSGGIAYSVTDNGAGAFVDAKIAAGSINYDTGAVSVTFAAGFFPTNQTPISLSGTTKTTFDVVFQERVAIGDGTSVTFSLTLENTLIRPTSMVFGFVIAGTTYYVEDDGAGGIQNITGAHAGVGSSINYVTGQVSIVLANAPDQNTNIDVTYNKRGLIASTINYATSQISAIAFAPGFAPDNGAPLHFIGSWRNHADFAGIDVLTGILLVNQAGKRIHIRDARGYLDVGSEGYDGSVYPHYCKPFDIFSLAAYVRKINGSQTGYLRIRFWDGTSAYTQVPAGTVEWDSYSKFSGNFSVVDDPYAPGINIYQFSITETARHDKLAVAFQVPPGARSFSVEFETDTVDAIEGSQVFSVSGLYLSQGTTAMSYSPPSEISYLPRPTDNTGRTGRVLTYGPYGKTSWVDPQLLGVAAISTLNGLSAAIQTLSIGVAGNSPSWASAISSHVLNIPIASTVGVTAGLVAYANWINWQNMASGVFNQAATDNTFTRGIVPSITNNIDLGTSVVKWRSLYAENVYADTRLQVGGATNYGWFSVVGAALVGNRSGAVVTFDLTAYTAVTASVFQTNRLYGLGTSDAVHLEIIGDAVQTSNIFNIQNSSNSSYMRGDKNLFISHVGGYSLTNNSVSQIGFLVKGAAGQTANIWEVQNSGSTTIAAVDKDGVVITSGVRPRTTNSYNLGTSSFYWNAGYIRDLYVGTAAGFGVATNLIPKADATYDLGSSAYSWRNAYVGTIYLDGSTVKIKAGDDAFEVEFSAGSGYLIKGLTPGAADALTIGSSYGQIVINDPAWTNDVIPFTTAAYTLGQIARRWSLMASETAYVHQYITLGLSTSYIFFPAPGGGIWSDEYFKVYYRAGTLNASGVATFNHSLDWANIGGMSGLVRHTGTTFYAQIAYYNTTSAYADAIISSTAITISAGSDHYSQPYRLLVFTKGV